MDRAEKTFTSSYNKWVSNKRKLVEVKLQHKFMYNGLQSEHWWVLCNDLYNVYSLELPPQYFGKARAVAHIKLTGTSMSEATICLYTEVCHSFLQTEVSITFWGVTIDEQGHFRCHDSSDTQVLETPAPSMFASRPTRPPPGF